MIPLRHVAISTSQNRRRCLFPYRGSADRPSDLLVRQIDRLRRVYGSVQQRYPFETIAICVLPDHLHALWSLPPSDADFPLRWNLIKGGFSRGLASDARRSASKIGRREKGIWQRRYWEHTIRNDRDYATHMDDIHFNPVKHGLVTQVVAWPFSSFHKSLPMGLYPLAWTRQG